MKTTKQKLSDSLGTIEVNIQEAESHQLTPFDERVQAWHIESVVCANNAVGFTLKQYLTYSKLDCKKLLNELLNNILTCSVRIHNDSRSKTAFYQRHLRSDLLATQAEILAIAKQTEDREPPTVAQVRQAQKTATVLASDGLHAIQLKRKLEKAIRNLEQDGLGEIGFRIDTANYTVARHEEGYMLYRNKKAIRYIGD